MMPTTPFKNQKNSVETASSSTAASHLKIRVNGYGRAAFLEPAILLAAEAS
jgi:hypothetical protein